MGNDGNIKRERVKPFLPNGAFLYLLKISENLTAFLMFLEVRERMHWEQMVYEFPAKRNSFEILKISRVVTD